MPLPWGWRSREHLHPGFREVFDDISLIVVCARIMTRELDCRASEHNLTWPRRLINDFLSTSWEVCRRATRRSLPRSVLFVYFLSATGVESMLITSSAATTWGGMVNCVDDRTKYTMKSTGGNRVHQWNVTGRKGSLTFWTNSTISKFTIGDMRLGWRSKKRGVFFVCFIHF